MKNILLALFILAFFTDCAKNKSEEPMVQPPIDTVSHIIELGKATVVRNWIPWNASFSASYYPNNKNRFYLEGSAFQHGSDHTFYIRDISSTEGVQYIERANFWNGNNGIPEASYFVLTGGDALINSYDVDSTRIDTQYIKILHYDPITQIVEGRFQTILEGPTTAPFLWDTIKMTEGKFRLKIRN